MLDLNALNITPAVPYQVFETKENNQSPSQKIASKVTITVEANQSLVKGLVWGGATLISGASSAASGLVGIVTHELAKQPNYFSHELYIWDWPRWFTTDTYSFKFNLSVGEKTWIPFTVGAAALGLLTLRCFSNMEAHLGLSHNIQRIESNQE